MSFFACHILWIVLESVGAFAKKIGKPLCGTRLEESVLQLPTSVASRSSNPMVRDGHLDCCAFFLDSQYGSTAHRRIVQAFTVRDRKTASETSPSASSGNKSCVGLIKSDTYHLGPREHTHSRLHIRSSLRLLQCKTINGTAKYSVGILAWIRKTMMPPWQDPSDRVAQDAPV